MCMHLSTRVLNNHVGFHARVSVSFWTTRLSQQTLLQIIQMSVLLDALTILPDSQCRRTIMNNLELPGAHVQGPQVCTRCDLESSTSPWLLFLSLACGKFFNGPCDTSIAVDFMQACIDIGHTHAPVETAMEGSWQLRRHRVGLHYIGSIL
jgi:hypothetical protein